MSGWERTHRRYRLVYAVAEDVRRNGKAAVTRWQGAIDAEFGGPEGFLLDVRRRWLTAVAAHSEAAVPEAAAARHNVDLRTLLDAFAARSELAVAEPA